MGWPSPPGGPCAPPPPGVAYPNGNPLQRCSSFSTTRPPPLVSPPLHFPLRLHFQPWLRLHFRPWLLPSLRMRSSAPLSPALLCSPPLLLPFQIYSRCRPLPDRAYGGGMEKRTARRRRNRAEDGEEAAESSRGQRGGGGIERNRRGDDGIEGASA